MKKLELLIKKLKALILGLRCPFFNEINANGHIFSFSGRRSSLQGPLEMTTCLMHSKLLRRVHRSTPVVGEIETKRTGLEDKDFPGQHMHTALVSVHARQWRR